MEERGEMVIEQWNRSPKESSELSDFPTISPDVTRGGMFWEMPFTIINANASQNVVVCLRIRALNVPSARVALSLNKVNSQT